MNEEENKIMSSKFSRNDFFSSQKLQILPILTFLANVRNFTVIFYYYQPQAHVS